ncbi:type I-C CRISPR-associated protein Cas5c [Nocardia halotolerans]|uniref:pre-crRNA processing endonuclease n=1 Tax=Nocardia halotolerans TaxID=1755878 RepID=A0ABV8VJE6_9NOCA
MFKRVGGHVHDVALWPSGIVLGLWGVHRLLVRIGGLMSLVVQVWGPGACFTQPGLTAERVSYPVMTPTAAMGALKAVYWKPEFEYRITHIEVLAPIKQFTLRRNETTEVVSLADAASGRRRVDTAANRAQRNALCLKDVSYRIHAQINRFPHADKPEAAYRDQFRRRVETGRCFSQPFLGTREFPAYFGQPDDSSAVEVSAELGLVLHSIDYTTTPRRSRWFRAKLTAGVMEVPKHGLTEEQL